jgi:hypothetical protein
VDLIPLFSDDYLFSIWEPEFQEYFDSGQDNELVSHLRKWADRDLTLTETQTEGVFVQQFFSEIWLYWGTGQQDQTKGYCLNAQYGVEGAGQTGGKGAADLALGWFGSNNLNPVPQVLCEFKDIRSGLDAPQNRKGNNRSPVKQCFDYLKYAFDQTPSHSPVIPTWGIVTDMNEFRLYARRVGDSQFQRFFILSPDNQNLALIDDGKEAAFQRFLFKKIFHRESLLTLHGKSEFDLPPYLWTRG